MKGIYKILNTVNNKFYIGSSKDIYYRWEEEHIKKLNNNNHDNIILQRAWNKYGHDNFILIIIEIVSEDISTEALLEREQYYLDLLNPKYNIGKHASGGDNLTNNPNRSEIIEQIKKSTLKRIKDLGEEYWIKWGERYKGENNPNYGNRWSDEQKENNRKKMKLFYETNESYRNGKTNEELFGKDKAEKISEKISNFGKTRTGKNNPFFGKTHSTESIIKMSEKRKGNIPTNIRKIEIDSIIYKSLNEASRILNIPTPTIHHRINSKNLKFKDYKYLD